MASEKEHVSWSSDDIQVRTLDGPPPAGFSCGAEMQDKFLYERAWRDQKRSVSVTHLFFIKGILAAYVTLTSDKLRLGPTERPKGVSWRMIGALKIAQLAVDKRFAGSGLGKRLVGFAIDMAMRLRVFIGCRYVTLDAEPNVVGWYERQGFEHNKEDQSQREIEAREREISVEQLARSMRFDLREVGHKQPRDTG